MSRSVLVVLLVGVAALALVVGEVTAWYYALCGFVAVVGAWMVGVREGRRAAGRVVSAGDGAGLPVLESCSGQSLGEILAANRAVGSRETLYRLIAEQSTDLIALVDENERIAYASSAFERILGRAPQSVLGGSLADFLEPDDVAAMGQELGSVITFGSTTTVTMRARHVDGSLRWLDARASLLAGPSARFVLFVARDVTERRGLEEQLSEAQRLETVGKLAGGVAHDFNNIIGVLSAHVDWLEQVLPADHDGQASIVDLRETVVKAKGLSQQLLALARRQVLERREIDLNEFVTRFVGLIGRMLGDRIEIAFQPSLEPARVRVDPTQLDQVLMNLAVNARDAMPEGGKLQLTVEGPFVLGGVRAAFASHNERASRDQSPVDALVGMRVIRLVVKDSGEGMDEDTIRKAFEPFFTTKRPGKGTGLGLSTTYGIVRQHGGVIRITSSRGQGAEFEIILPELGADTRCSGPVGPTPLPRTRDRISQEQARFDSSGEFPAGGEEGKRLWAARLRPSGVSKCGPSPLFGAGRVVGERRSP
jgi:two-component system, cell cycle sensor histidine kinase and response regulator CckA